MTKIFEEYYLGLDIGTGSVGWAVTDKKYNILQFNGKAMWGIHLFENGKPAEERRKFRTARRRLGRRNQRISLLQDLFENEVCKVDPSFFQRLEESRLHDKDKTIKQKNTLFNDPNLNDKDFHKKYPTAYHLRLDLMNTAEKPDIRLVYLACHHIIKYRGHFLFKGLSDEDMPPFREVFDELINKANDELGLEMSVDECIGDVERTIADSKISMTDKSERLENIFGSSDNKEKEFLKLLAGRKVNMKKLFDDESLKEMGFSFKDSNYEDLFDEYADELGPERSELISLAKIVYDWSILMNILGDSESISESKVKNYTQHSVDLKTLKWAVRTYLPDRYDDVFKNKDSNNNYCAYVKKAGKSSPEKSCQQDSFCDFLNHMFNPRSKDNKDIPRDPLEGQRDDPVIKDMIDRIRNGTFMPKQTVKSNSVVPYTIHRKELKKILDNAGKWHRFLNETDESGKTVKEKILILNEFKVPYYVGPLVSEDKSDKAWMIRKRDGKITPWNFEDMVDQDRSAMGFIERLTNKCTYIRSEKVLPKNSLLYSRFELYNELNNLSVNKERIDPDLKNAIVRDLFENVDSIKKISRNDIKDYLKKEGRITDNDEITGIDSTIKSNLRSYVQIKRIVGDKIKDRKLIEDVIKTITIFGDERQRVSKKLEDDHSDKLTKDEIQALSKLQFKDWGKLSEKLLVGLYGTDKSTGMKANIMTFLELTSDNLNQILYKCDFLKQIEELNDEFTGTFDGKISYKLVEELYVSPTVKRSIWRTIDVVNDIMKIIGHAPAKIFVETTRETEDNGKKGKRTTSRLDQLKKLYRECKKDASEHNNGIRQMVDSISDKNEADLKARNLYFYYLQHGKCMYCSKPINLEDLNNREAADKDHIYPQSKIKDDSILNNMVLVCRDCNQKKGDRFPLPPEWQNRQRAWWEYLKDNKFITAEKYSRLTRTTDLNEEELAKFIARQIVETSQSVKGAIEVLKKICEGSDIVYVKGGNVSDFRHDNGFIKCRNVNDYHHAKDAYLNIVVGNVYDTKFTKDPLNFIRSGKQYSLKRMYDFNIDRNGVNAWVPEKNLDGTLNDHGTMITVRKMMRRNNIQFTRYSFENKGGFYNQLPLRKGKNLNRLKSNLDTEEYGGYSGEVPAYLTLIRYKKGTKAIKILETVPVRLASNSPTVEDLEKYFIDKGYADVKILIPRIKIKTLFEVDGFRLNVSGGKDYTCAVQLVISDRSYNHCKKIYNYIEELKENRNLNFVNQFGQLKLNKDELNQEVSKRNLEVYDELVDKLNGKYSMPFFNNLKAQLNHSRANFEKADLNTQAKMISELLKVFKCDPSRADGLKEINCKANGRISSINPLSYKTVKIIYQSPSGMFEKEIDLNVL